MRRRAPPVQRVPILASSSQMRVRRPALPALVEAIILGFRQGAPVAFQPRRSASRMAAMGGARGLVALLGLGMIAQVGVLGSTTLADSTAGHALQIYGLTLDDTRLGNGFCEKRDAGDPVRRDCGTSEQALPEIVE